MIPVVGVACAFAMDVSCDERVLELHWDAFSIEPTLLHGCYVEGTTAERSPFPVVSAVEASAHY